MKKYEQKSNLMNTRPWSKLAKSASVTASSRPKKLL